MLEDEEAYEAHIQAKEEMHIPGYFKLEEEEEGQENLFISL